MNKIDRVKTILKCLEKELLKEDKLDLGCTLMRMGDELSLIGDLFQREGEPLIGQCNQYYVCGWLAQKSKPKDLFRCLRSRKHAGEHICTEGDMTFDDNCQGPQEELT